MKRRLLFKLFLLILITMIFTTAIYEQEYTWSIVVFIFMALMIYSIIVSSTKLYDQLNYIVKAIENKDYNFNFVESNKSQTSIYLNRIKAMLERVRHQEEERERYYQHILDHIQLGVLVVNANGTVLKSNRALHDILGIKHIVHLNHISEPYPQLDPLLSKLKVNLPESFTIETEREHRNISVNLTEWGHESKTLRIYTFGNISKELEHEQLESWNRLSRVLTHEIMNNLTPILSISDSITRMKDDLSEEVVEGLNIISSTGNSLVEFVNNYRRFTSIHPPVFSAIQMHKLLSNCVGRFETSHPRIDFTIELQDEKLMTYADENQITQVIVNLLKNAIESIHGNGAVAIHCYCHKSGDVIIEIHDSGHKIDKETQLHMFVPFFTTKEGGSGVGLSISRQIMKLHHGGLTFIQNDESKYFLLRFS